MKKALLAAGFPYRWSGARRASRRLDPAQELAGLVAGRQHVLGRHLSRLMLSHLRHMQEKNWS
jgi:hypothetical protein